MHYHQTSRMRVGIAASVCLLIFGSGCVSPFNTKTPQVVHRPAEVERREAQVHDPYPDSTFGPDTGFRPLGFTEQRSEPQRAKDRFYTAMLRRQNGSPFAPQSMDPTTRRPQVSNPHYYGAQQYDGQQSYIPQQQTIPAAYTTPPTPQPIQVYLPQDQTIQQVSGVAPVSPPVYYPSSYR